MPRIENQQSDSFIGSELSASPTLGGQIDIVTGFLRRRYWLILIGLLLAVPFGALYLRLTPATYTASATTLIETRKNPLESLLGSSGGGLPDFAWVESQIGVLRSRNVAAQVVKQLRLAEDPTFIRSAVDPFDKLLARFGRGEPDPRSEPERVDGAIAALNKGLSIQRIGASYLVRIDFKSENKELATKIANAITDAYVFDQLNAKYQANRRAGDWLQERLQALREQASAAERAVLDFRAKNNIVPAGGGAIMSEKELSQKSSGLVAARVQTSELQLRVERIEAVRQAYQQDKPSPAAEDESVSEAMSSGIINNLRTQYLDLVNREADWSARFGKNHAAVVKLRNQIRNIRKSIYDELGRIEETLKSDYEIAKKRQDEYEQGLAGLVSQSTGMNQAQIALFSLEAAAQSYRKLYDNFLQRHTESVQQQTFPVTEARQVSAASASKTGPKTLQVWLVTILAGGVIGAGLGALREMMDRKFRTREQVQSFLAAECLAVVPLLADSRKRAFSRHRPLALEPRRSEEFAIQRGARSISSTPNSMWTVINSPSSPYAEAIRSIKLTVDLNSKSNGTKVVGLTSCLASEGKSTLAAAMATLIAQGGARVILLDCDLRHPSLSRVLAPDAEAGFVEVVAGTVDLADAIWTDPATNLEFLPAGARAPNATEILASEGAKSLFDRLQIQYDYVVVDLAPLVAGIDVRVTANLIDSYLLVVEWGTTKIDAVQYALRAAPGVHDNIVGVVLNKVDMAAMARYDRHGADYYYGQPRHLRSVN